MTKKSGDDSTNQHDEAASALAEFDKLVAQQGKFAHF